MTMLKFLLSLHEKLSDMPQDEVEERLHFYSEMIEDRMEEGLCEEEAVSAVGSVDEIASQIIVDISPSNISSAKAKGKKKLGGWTILLLVLGSPVWLSLLIAAFAVIFTLYVSLWAVIISLWAAFVSAVGCSVGSLIAGVIFVCNNYSLTGIAIFGAGAVCVGLSAFLLLGCKAATKGILLLTKKILLWTKKCATKKEVA